MCFGIVKRKLLHQVQACPEACVCTTNIYAPNREGTQAQTFPENGANGHRVERRRSACFPFFVCCCGFRSFCGFWTQRQINLNLTTHPPHTNSKLSHPNPKLNPLKPTINKQSIAAQTKQVKPTPNHPNAFHTHLKSILYHLYQP